MVIKPLVNHGRFQLPTSTGGFTGILNHQQYQLADVGGTWQCFSFADCRTGWWTGESSQNWWGEVWSLYKDTVYKSSQGRPLLQPVGRSIHARLFARCWSCWSIWATQKTRMFWDFLRGCLKRGGTFERQHHLLRLLRDFHWRLTLKQQRCYAASAGRPVVASCSAPRHSWRQFACGCWPRERGGFKDERRRLQRSGNTWVFSKAEKFSLDRKVMGHLSS